MGLFSSLDIGTYIPPTCGPLSTFFGPFGGAQMPQNSTKNLFSGCSGPLLLIDMDRGLFSCLNPGTYILPTWGTLCTFWGPFGGAQMPQNSIKKAIFWFFYREILIIGFPLIDSRNQIGEKDVVILYSTSSD
jgi:hypothetical protein